MTAESKSFMCLNEACNSEDSNRSAILHYEPNIGKAIHCPQCNSVYIEHNNVLLRLLDSDKDEYTIDGLAALQTFKEEENDTRKYIPRLIIKNIHQSDLKEELISFRKCVIEELVLEDIQITSAYNPIYFFDCDFKRIYFRNISIKKPNVQHYHTPWTIYGIHFFNSSVKNSFSIENLQASMMISACHIECDINLSKGSDIDLVMLHNGSDPKINVDKSTKYNHVYKAEGISTEQDNKIVTAGKPIKGISIKKLIINPGQDDKTLIENCSIRSIILPEDSTIKGELVFINCYIESIHNIRNYFEKNIVFKGCTFYGTTRFADSKFSRSLILEACNFREELSLIELKIEQDLRISYSRFQKDLLITNCGIGGYAYSNFVVAENDVLLESVIITRDLIFKCIESKGDFTATQSDIGKSFLLRNINVGGNFCTQWSNIGDLRLGDALIFGNTTIESSSIKENFFLTSNTLKGKFNTLFLTIQGKLIVLQNSFEGLFEMYYGESTLTMFATNSFEEECTFSTIGIGGKIMINRSFYKKKFSLDSITAGDLRFESNYLTESIDFSKSTFKDIFFTDSFVEQNLEISTLEANDIDFKHLRVEGSLDVYHSAFQDITIDDNIIYYSVEFMNTRANDVQIINNNLFNKIDIRGLQVHDLNFSSNELLYYQTNQSDDNNKQDQREQTNELNILDLRANNTEFIDNTIEFNSNIYKGEINNIKFHNNEFQKEVKIQFTEADEFKFSGNLTQALSITGGIYTNIGVYGNDYIGQLTINNIETGKDCDLSSNTYAGDFRLSWCRINNNMDITNCLFKGKFDIHNCFQGSNFDLGHNIYWQDFHLRHNTIHGSLKIFSDKANKAVQLTNNTIKGNLRYKECDFFSSFHLEENTIEQMFHITDLSFESRAAEYIPEHLRGNTEQKFFISELEITPFDPPRIFNNSFNAVSFERLVFSTAIYFDNNTVLRNLTWGRKDSKEGRHGLLFIHPVSFSENKIRSVAFNNLTFSSAICMQNNHIESGLALYNTDFKETMDLSGSFIGGTCIFSKVNNYNDGDLILDNTFIDKRIRFIKTEPRSFSFINANLNNFEIPSDWRMRRSNLIRLRDKTNDSSSLSKSEQKEAYNKKKYIFKETALKKNIATDEKLPFSLIKTYCDSTNLLENISSEWKILHENILPWNTDTLLDNVTGSYYLLKYRSLISECIGKHFAPVYYGFVKQDDLDMLMALSVHFTDREKTDEPDAVPELIQHLSSFFSYFHYALKFFSEKEINLESGKDIKSDTDYKSAINYGLQEQYQVLRHIYGSNGELGNEDRAYYKWMHHHNIANMREGSFWSKTLSWGKWLLFEKIFGWGVNLLRIVFSTFVMVALFAIIYRIIFAFNPLLKIKWDEGYMDGKDIDIWYSGILALQTTFSAVLGDWAPIGSGIIKLPMTINAILGVLFVTFMIGAYGRKMLR